MMKLVKRAGQTTTSSQCFCGPRIKNQATPAPAYQNMNGPCAPKGPMNPPPRLLICHMICCIMRCCCSIAICRCRWDSMRICCFCAGVNADLHVTWQDVRHLRWPGAKGREVRDPPALSMRQALSGLQQQAAPPALRHDKFCSESRSRTRSRCSELPWAEVPTCAHTVAHHQAS